MKTFINVYVMGYSFVTLPSEFMKHQNGSNRCPSKCKSHSGGDSVALRYSLPLLPPPGISVPDNPDKMALVVASL